ncbi:hypothetical protein S4A8_02768 [Salinisphaera sp. S4-8]
MKTSRYTDSQILAILKQAEAGTPVPQLCREHDMSSATFYKWRSKYGGMDASLMARMKELEDENRRLKKMYAEERLKAEIVQEALDHPPLLSSSPIWSPITRSLEIGHEEAVYRRTNHRFFERGRSGNAG